jgi:hypothetical protein
MIRLPLAVSPVVRDFLARWAPTNRLLAAIRTRRGLKWGVPAMGIGVLCWLVAATLTAVIRDGGPTWLNALVLLACWDGFKLVWVGPVSLALLARTRWHERKRRVAESSPDLSRIHVCPK